MKRKIDLFSLLSIIFTAWYVIFSIVFMLECSVMKLVSVVGEILYYPIMWIITIGGVFAGEYQVALIAWAPIIAVIIGIAGWLSRGRKGKAFFILPLACILASIVACFTEGTALFIEFVCYILPIFSSSLLIVWVIIDLFMLNRRGECNAKR